MSFIGYRCVRAHTHPWRMCPQSLMYAGDVEPGSMQWSESGRSQEIGLIRQVETHLLLWAFKPLHDPRIPMGFCLSALSLAVYGHLCQSFAITRMRMHCMLIALPLLVHFGAGAPKLHWRCGKKWVRMPRRRPPPMFSQLRSVPEWRSRNDLFLVEAFRLLVHVAIVLHNLSLRVMLDSV